MTTAYQIPQNSFAFPEFTNTPEDQALLQWDAASGKFIYAPAVGGSWGSITGTLSDQADLQTALDQKATLGADNNFSANNVFQRASLGNTAIDNNIYLNLLVSLASPSTVKAIRAKVTNTNATATIGVEGFAFNTGPGGGAISVVGINAQADYNGAGTMLAVVGNQSQGSNSGSGIATNIYGQNSSAYNLSTGGAGNVFASFNEVVTLGGTIADARGVVAKIRRITGAITVAKGFSLEQWSGTNIATSYGIYADASIDVGTIRYFIYSLSTSPSFFTGALQAASFTGDGANLTGINAGNLATGTLDDARLSANIATKAYADSLVVGLLDDRGSHDASANLFPATGGSGAAGAILKGDLYFISVAGVLGGVAVGIGDSVRALVDTPGQTSGNWAVLESNLGFVPENVANKATGFGVLNDTLYPTTQAVANYAQPSNANLTTWATIAPSANVQTFLGGANFAAMRTSLGVAIGSNVQAWSARLDEAAAIGSALQQIRVNAGGNALEYFTPSSSGANAALSNLASVAINTDLLPASNQKLGSATLPFLESYTGSTTQYERVQQTAGLITYAALGSATNIGMAYTAKGTGDHTFSGRQALFPSGTQATNPGIAFAASPNTGLWYFSNGMVMYGAGTEIGKLNDTGIQLSTGKGVIFLTTVVGGTLAAGLFKNADGVVEVNNGSAGGLGMLLSGRVVTPRATTPTTITSAQKRTLFTNEGASALNVQNLPTAVAGLEYAFYVQDADGIQVVAAAGDTIRINGSVSAAAGNAQSTTVGSSLLLVAINATEWVAITSSGTWSVT